MCYYIFVNKCVSVLMFEQKCSIIFFMIIYRYIHIYMYTYIDVKVLAPNLSGNFDLDEDSYL